MVAKGERYRLLEQVGNNINSDGTPGAPLLAGQVGTVKQLDDKQVVLDFPMGEEGEGWMSQPRRSVSFGLGDLADLFERVED